VAGARGTSTTTFAGLSVIHAGSVSGSVTEALSDAAIPDGGPVWMVPPGSNRSIGGVLPMPFSSNGST
jgi:hypothetical protein